MRKAILILSEQGLTDILKASDNGFITLSPSDKAAINHVIFEIANEYQAEEYRNKVDDVLKGAIN